MMAAMDTGFQSSGTAIWLHVREGEPVPDVLPVWRNGGPRDGDRLGTAFKTSDGWAIHFGVDESDELLPGRARRGYLDVPDEPMSDRDD